MQFPDYLAAERLLANLNYLKQQAIYDLPYEQVSEDGAAISGKYGWLFIREGSNGWESQLSGQTVLSPAQVLSYQQLHQQRLDWLAAMQGQYVHVVFPEKQVVLSDKRWLHPQLASNRPALQLAQALGERFIYPDALLSQMSANAELYYRGNSHTCLSGCWLVFQAVVAKLWPQRTFAFSQLALDKTAAQHDLICKYEQMPCLEDIYQITPTWACIYDNQQSESQIKHVGRHRVFKNANAMYAEKILIVGDSYSFDVGFSDMFAAFFQEVHFIWGRRLDKHYIQQHGIDVVIAETAERFLIRLPEADQG